MFWHTKPRLAIYNNHRMIIRASPTADLFRSYFSIVEHHFGDLALKCIRHGVTATELAADYLSNPKRRADFGTKLGRIKEEVEAFWNDFESSVDLAVSSLPGLKARFGGDIGPQATDDLFQRTGVYFDTLLVPDPLQKTLDLPARSKNRDFYILKFGILQHHFREVYLAEVGPPIAVLVKPRFLTKVIDPKAALTIATKLDCVSVTNYLYEQSFETFEQAETFCSKFSSLKEAVNETADPNFYYQAEDVPRVAHAQVEAHERAAKRDWDLPPQITSSGGQMLFWDFFGRMMQANELLAGASASVAHPLIAAPVSYHWLGLKIRANRKSLSKELVLPDVLDLARTNSLLSENLAWLSAISLPDLIALRRQGGLGEIRAAIDKDLQRLSGVALENQLAVINQVDSNLSHMLREHAEKVRQLQNAAISDMLIGGIPMVAGLVVAALNPLFGVFVPAWVLSATGIVGAAKLTDLIKTGAKVLREGTQLQRSSVGILWAASKRAEVP